MDDIYNAELASGPVYHGQVHPSFPFLDSNFRGCENCELSCGRAVPGAGPKSLTKIKLILISDYPGHYEKTYGFPQVPRPYAYAKEDEVAKSQGKSKRRRSPFPVANSGEYIRWQLKELFDLNPFEEVYYTNAIKCPTEVGAKLLNVGSKHLKACLPWLQQELDVLNNDLPILLAGSKALAMFGHITALKRNGSVMDYYNQVPFMYKDHPVVVTHNPAIVARNRLRLLSNCTVQLKGGGPFINPTSVRPWDSVPSPQYFYSRTLWWLAPYLYPESTTGTWYEEDALLSIKTPIRKTKTSITVHIAELYTPDQVLAKLQELQLGIEITKV